MLSAIVNEELWHVILCDYYFFKLIYFFVSYPFLWHEWNKIGTSDFIFSIGLVILYLACQCCSDEIVIIPCHALVAGCCLCERYKIRCNTNMKAFTSQIYGDQKQYEKSKRWQHIGGLSASSLRAY